MTNSTFASPNSDDRKPQRQRHPLRFRLVNVVSRELLSPSLLRLTLTGDELQGFFSPGFDDHAKLIFPDPDTGEIPRPTVTEEGIAWPDGKRPLARDYTPRYFDAEQRLLTIDFALHDEGVATDWARKAEPGDELGIAGPRGSFIVPANFDWHLLVGDETAIPAISRRLEELPADARAIAVIEIDSEEHELPITAGAKVDVHWALRRGAAAGQSDAMLKKLQTLDFPAGDYYAWVACESATAKTLRQYLLSERAAQAKWIRASGYWKPGKAATHDTHED